MRTRKVFGQWITGICCVLFSFVMGNGAIEANAKELSPREQKVFQNNVWFKVKMVSPHRFNNKLSQVLPQALPPEDCQWVSEWLKNLEPYLKNIDPTSSVGVYVVSNVNNLYAISEDNDHPKDVSTNIIIWAKYLPEADLKQWAKKLEVTVSSHEGYTVMATKDEVFKNKELMEIMYKDFCSEMKTDIEVSSHRRAIESFRNFCELDSEADKWVRAIEDTDDLKAATFSYGLWECDQILKDVESLGLNFDLWRQEAALGMHIKFLEDSLRQHWTEDLYQNLSLMREESPASKHNWEALVAPQNQEKFFGANEVREAWLAKLKDRLFSEKYQTVLSRFKADSMLFLALDKQLQLSWVLPFRYARRHAFLRRDLLALQQYLLGDFCQNLANVANEIFCPLTFEVKSEVGRMTKSADSNIETYLDITASSEGKVVHTWRVCVVMSSRHRNIVVTVAPLSVIDGVNSEKQIGYVEFDLKDDQQLREKALRKASVSANILSENVQRGRLVHVEPITFFDAKARLFNEQWVQEFISAWKDSKIWRERCGYLQNIIVPKTVVNVHYEVERDLMSKQLRMDYADLKEAITFFEKIFDNLIVEEEKEKANSEAQNTEETPAADTQESQEYGLLKGWQFLEELGGAAFKNSQN